MNNTLSECYERIEARHSLLQNPKSARLYEAFGGKQLAVEALIREVITRRKLVRVGALKEALEQIPRQYDENECGANDRSEVASAAVINALIDDLESERNNQRRHHGSGLSDRELVNAVIELLIERDLGWEITDRLGYVRQSC